jgi:hypothetical protein
MHNEEVESIGIKVSRGLQPGFEGRRKDEKEVLVNCSQQIGACSTTSSLT